MLRKKINSFVAALCCALLIPMTVDAKTYDVPTNNSFKTYMSYKAIKNQSSAQYALQQKCTTTEEGFRVYEGRYTIALGTYYTKSVGTYVDVYLVDGTVIPCIVGDIKSDAHTDSTNRQIPVNGNVVEFIVDTDVMDSSVLASGDISTIPGFSGEIAYLELLDSDGADVSEDDDEQEPEVEELPTYVVNGKHCIEAVGYTTYIISYVADGKTITLPVAERIYTQIVTGISFIRYDANTGVVSISIE